MNLEIVLIFSCGKDVCGHDREDSETCFEDEYSNAVINLSVENYSCQERKLCLVFLAESCTTPSTVGIPHRIVEGLW